MFRLIELPEPKCPELVYGIYPSGHRVFWAGCGKWRCKRCADDKIQALFEHLADVAHGQTTLHQITIPDEQAEAVRRSFRRAKASTWSVRYLDLSLRIVADTPTSGRNWTTEARPKIDVITEILDHAKGRQIKRARDFSRHWRMDKKAEVKRETMIYRQTFNSQQALDDILSQLGEDIRSDKTNREPYQLADILRRSIGTNFDLDPDD